MGLDPEERIHFRNLFSRTAQERLVLLSTHIIEDVQSVCDQIVVIHHGTILFTGTPEQLIQSAAGHVGVFYEREAGQEAGLHITARVNTSQGIRCRAVADKLPSYAQAEEPTLEGHLPVPHFPGGGPMKTWKLLPPGAGAAVPKPPDLADGGLDGPLPVLGLVLYKPATSTTMLSMYLANPAIASGTAGAILFGLLTILELDRACRSRVDILTDAVVSPLTTALTRLLALLTAAVLTAGLTMLVWPAHQRGADRRRVHRRKLCAGLSAVPGAGAALGRPGGGRGLPVYPPGGSRHRPVHRLLRPEPDGVGGGLAAVAG